MLRVGDILYGYCGGSFGDSYGPKRIEAIGADWVVARELKTNASPLFADVSLEELEADSIRWQAEHPDEDE